MCFYWESLKKQIRISGEGNIISEKESDDYFSSRPRSSQIGAWASKQSSEIRNRKVLMDNFRKIGIKFKKKNVPRPKFWVGIKIKPIEFEFWQGGEFRLHKREIYYFKKNSWERKILSP